MADEHDLLPDVGVVVVVGGGGGEGGVIAMITRC